MALFPASARIVAGVDAAQLRASPAAAKVQALAVESQADKNTHRRVPAPHRLRSAQADHQHHRRLPRRRARQRRLRPGAARRPLRRDAPRRLRARRAAEDAATTWSPTKRGRLTLWSSKRDPAVVGFFIDEQTFALGAGGWGARMADLADKTNPGDSAATNLELVRLVERAAGTHAIWGAAMVPAETAPLAGVAAGLRRGGDDQHAVGRDRLRQRAGGDADRGRRHARRRPRAGDQGDRGAARREAQPAGADARPRPVPGRRHRPRRRPHLRGARHAGPGGGRRPGHPPRRLVALAAATGSAPGFGPATTTPS